MLFDPLDRRLALSLVLNLAHFLHDLLEGQDIHVIHDDLHLVLHLPISSRTHSLNVLDQFFVLSGCESFEGVCQLLLLRESDLLLVLVVQFARLGLRF